MEVIKAGVERTFYHSFPRRRASDTPEVINEKGLELLVAISQMGLILAPEVVEWSIPLSDGSTKVIRHRQMRICFTELSQSELPRHAEVFGPFAMEFHIDILRQLGALPVIYVPQMVKGDRLFSSFGPVMVWMFEMARYTLDQLHILSRLANPEHALEMARRTNPEAHTVDPNYKLNLTNTNETGGVEKVFEIEASVARGFLDYLSYKTAPFDLMRGAIYAAQTLFYPTDDTRQDELLSYYRQREWRIIPGLAAEGRQQVRPATDAEKEFLLKFDNHFWTRVITDDKGSFRRVDEACILDEFQGKQIMEFVTTVIVPPAVVDRARKIFGDKVSSLEEPA